MCFMPDLPAKHVIVWKTPRFVFENLEPSFIVLLHNDAM